MHPRLTGIHNVGCAVTATDPMVAAVREVLAAPAVIERIAGGLGEQDADISCRTTFMRFGDGALLEVIEPLADDRPVQAFLARHGEGIYRVLFHVDDYAAAVDHLQGSAVRHRLVEVPVGEGRRGSMVLIGPRATAGLMIELADDALLGLVDDQASDRADPTSEEAVTLHSVVVAVTDLDDALAQLQRLFAVEHVVRVEEDGCARAFVPTGGHFLQLVAPVGAGPSAVRSHLEGHGQGPWAIAVTVPDLAEFEGRTRPTAATPTESPAGPAGTATTVLPGGLRIEARVRWPTAAPVGGPA